jgi:hypothetical protein
MVNTPDGSPEALLSEVTDGAFVCDLTRTPVPDGVAAMAGLEARIDDALGLARTQGFEKVWFRFDLAVPGGGPTLFAPVGKALRARLAAGALLRVMPASTGGWIARLT